MKREHTIKIHTTHLAAAELGHGGIGPLGAGREVIETGGWSW